MHGGFVLEKTEVAELHAEAHGAFLDGSSLVKESKLDAAVDLLRTAYALERKNLVYELTLIDALHADRKTGEAEPLFDEVLERESNDGRANLTAVRLMAITGRIADAESYYHRAIYGEWSENVHSCRRAVRTELVDFLLNHGRKEELLPELLSLEEEAGSDAALKKRVAHCSSWQDRVRGRPMPIAPHREVSNGYRSLFGPWRSGVIQRPVSSSGFGICGGVSPRAQ